MFPNKIIEVQKIERKKKKKEQLETHTHAIFCFATLAYYFFVIFAFMQKFRYVFFVKRAQPE
jgi:hypothetical protein